MNKEGVQRDQEMSKAIETKVEDLLHSLEKCEVGTKNNNHGSQEQHERAAQETHHAPSRPNTIESTAQI